MRASTSGTQFVSIVEELISIARSDNPDKVAAYLGQLPEETVLKLQTFMYFGRRNDNSTKLSALHADLLLNTVDRQDAIRTISEKVGALPDYLRRGIALARTRGIGLDATFSKPVRPQPSDDPAGR